MSASYYAYVVVGVPVQKSWLVEKKTKERGCNHPEVEGAYFCSACGSRMWIEEETLDLEHCSDRELSYFSSSEESRHVILGFALRTVSDSMVGAKVVPQATPEQKHAIKEFCRSAKIDMNDSDIGTYVVMYCSY